MEEFYSLISSYTLETSLLVTAISLYAGIILFKRRKNNKNNLAQSNENSQESNTQNKQINEQAIQITPTNTEKHTVETIIQVPAQTKRLRKIKAYDEITKDSFAVFSGSKLLIAEDNLINQKVIHGMLGSSGINIFMANNGQEALEILSNNKDIYLVLMDAHMPIVDGFEATEHIRADKSLEHVVVVALSGDTAADDVKKMKQVGMIEHLEKPLKIEKLYEMLYYYIDTVNGIKFNTVAIPTAKYLHTDIGLEICGQDSALYNEILNDFLNNYEGSGQKISSLIQQKNITTAQKILLDISGITANIGANDIAEMSTHFREALINNSQNKIFDSEHEFTNAFLNLIQEVKNHLKS